MEEAREQLGDDHALIADLIMSIGEVCIMSTRARPRPRPHARARTHAPACTRARTHARTHACTYEVYMKRGVRGFADALAMFDRARVHRAERFFS